MSDHDGRVRGDVVSDEELDSDDKDSSCKDALDSGKGPDSAGELAADIGGDGPKEP